MRLSGTGYSVARGTLFAVALVLQFGALTGCGVRAYQRENLGDPIMLFETDASEEGREEKWLNTREGSNGGTGGAGGGCACG